MKCVEMPKYFISIFLKDLNYIKRKGLNKRGNLFENKTF